MNSSTTLELEQHLEPICPRDDHRMKFESEGIHWKAAPEDKKPQTMASYHCNYDGCSVRYDLERGYFSEVLTPDHPYFIEEPGVNVLRCPQHGTWLYRKAREEDGVRYEWRCGVKDCEHVQARDASLHSEPPGGANRF
jgi:hypothetical protein